MALPINSYMTIQAIKLEFGDTQTLAHQDELGNWVLNEIPNYAEQMAICEQYDFNTGVYIGFIDALPLTGGSMSGSVQASASSLTTGQVRNIYCSTAEPTASDGSVGDIWVVYEE